MEAGGVKPVRPIEQNSGLMPKNTQGGIRKRPGAKGSSQFRKWLITAAAQNYCVGEGEAELEGDDKEEKDDEKLVDMKSITELLEKLRKIQQERARQIQETSIEERRGCYATIQKIDERIHATILFLEGIKTKLQREEAISLDEREKIESCYQFENCLTGEERE